MWLYVKKYRLLIFDIIIGLLIVTVIILTDLFIVGLKSSSGEIKEEGIANPAGTALNYLETEGDQSLSKLEPGQIVFLPILNFHHIDTAPSGLSEIAASYYITPADFEGIIKDLLDAGYKTMFVSELVDLLEQDLLPAEKVIALTFDDGNQDFYTNAWPILQRYGLKSSVYIMTGVRGENYLSQDQIVELDKTGLVEFGSHTVYHPKLTQLAADKRLLELETSKDELEELLGKPITVLCYPFGLYDQSVKNLTKAVGYKAGLTFDQDAWQNSDDLYELKRISVYPNLQVVKLLDKLKTEK